MKKYIKYVLTLIIMFILGVFWISSYKIKDNIVKLIEPKSGSIKRINNFELATYIDGELATSFPTTNSYKGIILALMQMLVEQ